MSTRSDHKAPQKPTKQKTVLMLQSSVWSSLHDVHVGCQGTAVFTPFILQKKNYLLPFPCGRSSTIFFHTGNTAHAFQQVASATSKCLSLTLHSLSLTNSIFPDLPALQKTYINTTSVLGRDGRRREEKKFPHIICYSLSFDAVKVVLNSESLFLSLI